MKILFTGGSSLTGMAFVQQLAKAGHDVTAIFRSRHEDYEGIRRERIDKIRDSCTPIFSCPFGSEPFLTLIQQSTWDLLCHHAADVTNYRSPDFDFAKALANNTCNIEKTLRSLQTKGCSRVLLTGSVFEQGEGDGTDNLRAVSPYGLSKGLTADVFKYFANLLDMKLAKFVIPNPFGPYEEGRFTNYLIQSWYSNQTPTVNTPLYVRDNIDTSLLALAYVDFAKNLSGNSEFEKFNPSCYCESQGAFTARFAREIGSRLGIACPFELKEQTVFTEPQVRVNFNPLDYRGLGWKEETAWDNLADYYLYRYATRMSYCE